MSNEEIDLLLAKHFSKESTADDEKRLEEWIKSNGEEYKALQQFWQDNQSAQQFFDTQAGWDEISGRLKTKPKIVPLYRRAAFYAAAMLLVVFAGFAYFNSSITIEAPKGQTALVVMGDGSKVTLNENARLRYKRFYWGKRTVELQGEALFEVTHRPEKAFVVQGENVSVNVLGTTFVVKTNGNAAFTSVLSGKVAVKNTQTNQTAVLVAGQTVEHGQMLAVKKETSQNLLSWQTKTLRFSNTPLALALADIADYYHINIKIAAPLSSGCYLTSNFQSASLADVLKELELVFHMQYRLVGDTLYIDKTNCQ